MTRQTYGRTQPAVNAEVAARLSEDRQCVHLICGYQSVTSHRLHAQITRAGLALWCRDCRCSHLLPWADVEAEREKVAFSERLR